MKSHPQPDHAMRPKEFFGILALLALIVVFGYLGLGVRSGAFWL